MDSLRPCMVPIEGSDRTAGAGVARSVIGRFLAKRGPGLHHVAFACRILWRRSNA